MRVADLRSHLPRRASSHWSAGGRASSHLCGRDRGYGDCRALLRHQTHQSVASFWYRPAFRFSNLISLALCDSRVKRRARRFFPCVDVSAASLSVLLISLIGRALSYVALSALLSEVFFRTGLQIRRAHPVF